MTERRFTEGSMRQLAANGVHKIDLLGERGAALVTTDELVAMAGLLVLSGTLPKPADRKRPPNPNIPSERTST